MTLSEFALVVGVEPKWVLNAAAAVNGLDQYSLPAARRLAVARAIHEALGVPLPRAFTLASTALRRYAGGLAAVSVGQDRGETVEATVDVFRILSALNARLARLRTMHAPARRGRRPAKRRDAFRRRVRRASPT